MPADTDHPVQPSPAREQGAEPAGALLVARGLRMSYGELVVLDGVDFQVGAGESVGVVGPNGAGKTTLLSALAGTVQVVDGSVTVAGRDLTRLPVHRRCRLGVARAYQVPRPFGGLTVLENVLVAAMHGAGLRRRAAHARALEALDRTGLEDVANRRADSLGLLSRKRLEVARALATGPSVLLLDEIAAGLTDAEAAELVTLVRQLRDLGLGVVWIEHIVHVLVQGIDRLVAMDAGRVIADGAPHDVLADAAVVDAYLGGAPR
jgi:branched-chain amino acid transport system ATP-binding protein